MGGFFNALMRNSDLFSLILSINYYENLQFHSDVLFKRALNQSCLKNLKELTLLIK